MKEIEFKGHQKSSFIDYPDKICTVLFTGGCNFKCPYCHNSELVENLGETVTEDFVFNFLDSRKKMIDAVCISGGEPTLHDGLYDFIRKLKYRGYFVKLDTNGTAPDILDKLIKDKLVDYVAMDIKAPISKYVRVTNSKVDIDKIAKSISIIKASDIDYEFRTTVCKELLTKEDILIIAECLKGSKRYYLQNFKDGNTVLGGEKKLSPFSREILREIEERIKNNFEIFKIRN